MKRAATTLALCFAALTAYAADNIAPPARQELPADQNAYPIWTNAFAGLQLPADDRVREATVNATCFDDALPDGDVRRGLDAWLESTKAPMALIDRGVASGQFQFPAPCDDRQKSCNELNGVLRVVKIRALRTRVCIEEGDYSAAAREVTAILRIGQMVNAGGGTCFQQLIGAGAQSVGLLGMRSLCAMRGTPLTVMRDLLDAVPGAPLRDVNLLAAYRVDCGLDTMRSLREFERRALDPTNRFPIRISRVLDLDATSNLLASFQSRIVSNALCSWPDRDRQIEQDAAKLMDMEGQFESLSYAIKLESAIKWKPGDRESRELWKDLEQAGRKQPNIYGRLHAGMSVTASAGALTLSVRYRTYVNLTRAYIALCIVRKETGKWPESLEAVRPLLKDLPVDLFSDKPVHYSREKGILWSVGPDEVDDGGDPQKDLVVPLPK